MNGMAVFGGTVEGRMLAERLSRCGIRAHVCTATPYGGALLRSLPGMTVHSKRMTSEEMRLFMLEYGIGRVIDATHPYAREVTVNIKNAAAAAGAEYLRVLRSEDYHANMATGISTVADAAGAVGFLTDTEGPVLLTTGSKELDVFCALPRYQDRLYVRVLPVPEVIQSCNRLGFDGAHIVAMQGPFSYELNLALLQQLGCRYLVTKNTGPQGGLDEKLAAALDAGAHVVMIDRPLAETGHSLDEIWTMLGIDARAACGSKEGDI